MSEFRKFRDAVEAQFNQMTQNNALLFTTKISREEMVAQYQDSFPEGTNPIFRERREHDCNSCNSFIQQVGNVVAIDKDLKLVSVWDVQGLPEPYQEVADTMSQVVKSFEIDSVFISEFPTVSKPISREQLTGRDWVHLSCKVPSAFVNASPGSITGKLLDQRNTLHRGLNEISLSAIDTALELIAAGSVFRGEEHTKAIEKFRAVKVAYDAVPVLDQPHWTWLNCKSPAFGFRGSAVGTWLLDLSSGMDIEEAVHRFCHKMTGYKRPKTIATPKMIEEARKKVKELGFEDSLARRHAVADDISVNEILFVDRDVRSRLKGGDVFDQLTEKVTVDNPKDYDKTEEMPIAKFLELLSQGQFKTIELLVENRHKRNFVALTAPVNPEAPSMFLWPNAFGWSYIGDLADAGLKEDVAKAGGDVTGVMRFSIRWNTDGFNNIDFDAHCHQPNGDHIYFGNAKRPNAFTKGVLDVDIRRPGKDVAVENITFPDARYLQEGRYRFVVHNYDGWVSTGGFEAEIEVGGQVYSFNYTSKLSGGQTVHVADVEYSKKEGFKVSSKLEMTSSSQTIWNVPTQQFRRVSMVLLSPNQWEGHEPGGNKHYMFMLEGCQADSPPRGFYNEFLNRELEPHRKTFEMLGGLMRPEPSEDQLSGLGFSSTQKSSVIVRVTGNVKRPLKIIF